MTAASDLVRLASGFGLLEAARRYPEHGLLFSDMTGGGVFRLRDGGAEPELVSRAASHPCLTGLRSRSGRAR
jgi:hypothetical protein